MAILQEPAYAKINLSLDVLDKRQDGYHDVKMILHAISLHDDIKITLGTGKPWEILCDNPEIPTNEENLCYKAAKVYYETTGKDPNGITIEITKRIPIQAGLGGGRADAAAVLKALNRHDGNRFELGELCNLAERVGSDVPFCVLGGTALAEGRGEELTALPGLPPCVFVVCKPDFSNPTAELYSKLDCMTIASRPKTEEMIQALQNGNLEAVCKLLKNVFEPVVAEEHLEIRRMETVLRDCGALGAVMTGSGSAVYGIFPDFELAAMASMTLMERGYQTFLAQNV